MRIKVSDRRGWNADVEKLVIATCKAFCLPFLDRLGVMPSDWKGVLVISCVLPPMGCDSYVYFAHRSISGLPSDTEITLASAQAPKL